MAKPNFTLPNKPAIKSGSILSYNYTDDFTFVPAPLTFNRDSAATRVNEKGLIEDVGYFGPELVKNGDFSEIGSEWFNANNISPRHDATNTINSDGTITTELNNSNIGWSVNASAILNQYKIYKVEWKVISTNSNSGSFFYWNGVDSFSFGDLTQAGSGVYYVKGNASGANADFRFNGAQPNSTITWSLSVKEVGQNWSFGDGWSIEDGKAYRDTQASGSNLQQNNILTVGKKYKVTLEVVDNISINKVFFGTGTEFTLSGTGTQTFTGICSGNETLYIQASLSLSKIKIDNISVVEVLGDQPRIDYSDSLTEPSLLLEPQRTNLITYSEDFSNSSWSNTYTITPNSIISPDGTLNAYKITLGTGNGNLRTLNSVSSNTDYVFSFYAKRGTASEMKYRVFDFTIPYAEIIPKTSYYSQTNTDSWVRIEVPFTTGASTTSIGCYIDSDGQGDGDFYVWGAQLEEGSYATSYIPTAGSTATRLGETANNAGDVNVFNSEEGVLYAEIAALADDGTARTISINNTVSNRVFIQFRSSTGQVNSGVVVSGSLQGSSLSHSISQTSNIKMAFKYKANDYALFVNGSKVADQSSGNTFPAGTLNDISFDSGDGAEDFYGKVKNVQVFNKALTDRELEILTIQ